MASDRSELERLVLLIDPHLTTHAKLRTLLTDAAADDAVAQQPLPELRSVKAQIKGLEA